MSSFRYHFFFLYCQLQSFCHLLKTLLKTLFHTFNHYLLIIAWYYIHLARSKSETPRHNIFITFFWKLKFNVKEKLLLKPENKSNPEISGPPCASLICIETSQVNDFKHVLCCFVLFCFSALLVHILYAPCINHTVSSVLFSLIWVIWLTCSTTVCTLSTNVFMLKRDFTIVLFKLLK